MGGTAVLGDGLERGRCYDLSLDAVYDIGDALSWFLERTHSSWNVVVLNGASRVRCLTSPLFSAFDAKLDVLQAISDWSGSTQFFERLRIARDYRVSAHGLVKG